MPRPSRPTSYRISKSDLKHFYQVAPDVLRQYDQDRKGRRFSFGVPWIVTGIIPIIGLLFFDWSAREWFQYLLIGTWCSILCDLGQMLALHGRGVPLVNKQIQNSFVMVLADCIRKEQGSSRYRIRSEAKQAFQSNLRKIAFADVLFGAVGTFLSLLLFPGNLFAGFLDNTGVHWMLLLLIGFQVFQRVWDSMALMKRSPLPRTYSQSVPIGFRGVGLFLLLFLVGIVSGENSDELKNVSELMQSLKAEIIMWFVNGLAILFGAVAIFVKPMLWNDADWLRTHLRTTKTPPSDGRRKRKRRGRGHRPKA